MFIDDLSGKTDRVIRSDRTVCFDIENHFLVVGTLSHTGIFNCEFHVPYRSENSIDSDKPYRHAIRTVFFGWKVSASSSDEDIDFQCSPFIHGGNMKVFIEYLELTFLSDNIACGELFLPIQHQ